MIFNRPYLSKNQAVVMVIVRPSVCPSRMYCGYTVQSYY